LLPVSRRRLDLHSGRRRTGARGQSVVEFALVVPVLLFMVIAIADVGRVYAAAVAVESAAREAADFGAFERSNWTAVNTPTTLASMERRACVAAAGSHLQDYKTTDPVNHTTCSNPSFSCALEWLGAVAECGASAGFVSGQDCSDPLTSPPCTVHVHLDYTFHTILNLPPFPATFELGRDSRFRVSGLEQAP
jgi:hypothetical protein